MSLLDDIRARVIMENLNSTHEKDAKDVQLQTAKKMVKRLVSTTTYADGETNTSDSVTEVYKAEIEAKKEQYKVL